MVSSPSPTNSSQASDAAIARYGFTSEPDTRFSIRYYLIAVLFVVFDVETIFLFPWAVAFDQLPLFLFVEMFVFLAILLVGYVYAWRRGALEWA